MWSRYRAVTVLIFMGILMSLLMIVWTRFATASSNIQELEFDLDTITAFLQHNRSTLPGKHLQCNWSACRGSGSHNGDA